ncbi:MAG TPA: FecR domain-containing protein [Polyangiaceae bacterium]|nr:FecR domain-containing protein [Polyangiaceae bacterium]
MSPPHDTAADERGATNLGTLPRLLHGGVSEPEHAAGRERLMVSFGTRARAVPYRIITAAALLSFALVAVTLLLQKPAPLEYRVNGSAVTGDGWLDVPADRGALSLRFSEGTEIDLGPGSKGKVAGVTPEGARVVLGAGVLHARVVHRERARWTVAAGPYSIEVTGTAFDVGWSVGGERLELSLHDGSVVVRGPSLHDGLRVAAGQRLVAHARTGGAELSSLFAKESPPEPSNETTPPSPSAAEPGEPVEPAPPPRPAQTWAEMLASGNFRGVIEGARARGIVATLSRGTLADVVAFADAARYAHERDLARRGLLAERARFPGSAEARAAAFVLGRMADDAGASEEALDWYDRYLNESPGGSFAAEALGRKLVVLVHSGDVRTARGVAAAYLSRYPRGAHAAYAKEVLPNP